MRVFLSAAFLFLTLAVGASAQAWIERHAWPRYRPAAALAYDAKRDRVVLFGGGDRERLSDTWHWDGVGWMNVTRAASTPPPARTGHAMAYDLARGTVVMFGGEAELTALGDLWEWEPSRATWRVVQPASVRPPARSDHAMATDLARGRIVLFGGLDDAVSRQCLADTWEWDGTNWIQRAPAVSPQPRRGHAMAYDTLRARIVLFGGYDCVGGLGDTWEWDGNVWQQRRPTTSSPAGSGSMAFDVGRRRTLWFGAGQTWEWDGTSWTRRQPATTPVGDRIAYDAARGRVLLFGGSSLSPTTWEWDGVDWAPRPPPEQPHPGATAGDTVRQRVVLLNDSQTWEWDGARWSQRNPASTPTTRGLLAYDSRRRRTVLFGAANRAFQPETWEWDGVNWQQQSTVVSPAGRAGFALAYDEVRARTILFGGRLQSGQPLGDTWEWDGVNWVQRSIPGGPSPRFGHAMAYDAYFGRRIVLFGGQGAGSLLMDTWAWDGRWTLVYPYSLPTWRSGHTMAYHPGWSNVFLYGGLDSRSASLNDFYRWVDPQWNTVESPAETVRQSMLAYDPARDGLLLHGLDAQGNSATWTFGFDSRVTVYGTGCASSTVKPALTAYGQARLGNDRFALDVDGVRANGPVALLLSTAKASLVFGGCPLLVDPTTLVMVAGTSNSFGAESFVLPIPVDRRITGRIYAQAIGLDPSTQGFALTHGLEVDVGS